MELSDHFPPVMELKFSSSHALIAGNKPANVTVEAVSNACSANVCPERVERFGLFDSSAPNYNTYYPDATSADWNPSDEEFVTPTFRMLSETVVHKMGIPIDFGVDGVLKRSMQKMLGQTINSDHETMVANAIGSVSEVYWQDAYKIGDVQVPAGMNGVFKIDAKANPRIARGLAMDPPSIHSDSVTVRFKHKPSHEFDNPGDFWDKAGSYDENGELIRLLVTDIVLYNEVSLVAHGADPYAQVINTSGKITNPEMTKRSLSLTSDSGTAAFDFKDILTIQNTFTFNINSNKDDMDLSEILSSLGLEENAFESIEDLAQHFQDLAAANGALNALLAVKDDLTPESLGELIEGNAQDPPETELNEDQQEMLAWFSDEGTGTLEDVQMLVAAGSDHLEELRTQTLSFFALLYPDGNEELQANIEGASLSTLKALNQQYKGMVEERIPLSCEKCGSTELGRGKATKTEAEKALGNSYQEKQERFYKKNRRKNPSDKAQEN